MRERQSDNGRLLVQDEAEESRKSYPPLMFIQQEEFTEQSAHVQYAHGVNKGRVSVNSGQSRNSVNEQSTDVETGKLTVHSGQSSKNAGKMWFESNI